MTKSVANIMNKIRLDACHEKQYIRATSSTAEQRQKDLMVMKVRVKSKWKRFRIGVLFFVVYDQVVGPNVSPGASE